MLGRTPGRGRDVDSPADQRRVDVDLARPLLQILQLREREHLGELRGRLERARDDRELLVVRGIVDEHLEHEAVDLRLGQRIRALRLDRILRREHEERVRHREGVVIEVQQ